MIRALILLVLLACPALWAQDITATAEATGEERAIAKCREKLTEAITDKLCEWRAELWEPAMPGFPFERAERPQGFAYHLAESAQIDVEKRGNRWVATGGVSESSVRKEAAIRSTRHIQDCRRQIRYILNARSNNQSDRVTSLNYNSMRSVMVKMLTIYATPDSTGLADSLRQLTYENLRHVVIVPQEDIVVPEGESIQPRVRVYVERDNVYPLAGVSVAVYPQAYGDGIAQTLVSTDDDGWAWFDHSPKRPPSVLGDWTCEVLPPRENSRNTGLVDEYVSDLIGDTKFSFNVLSIGRRKTYLRSDLEDIGTIIRYLEDKGHSFVANSNAANWLVEIELKTINEGPDLHEGYVCIMVGRLTIKHDEAIVEVLETERQEAYAHYELSHAQRQAKAMVRKELETLTSPYHRM